MKKLVAEALRIAETQIGVREVGGANRGPQVEAYLKSIGLGGGNAWCAAFVYWCIHQAAGKLGRDNPYVKTGWCPTIAQWGRDGDCLEETPAAGDIFLRYGKSGGMFRACHTGFVSRVDGRIFETIEGNTNLAGSREGIGVFLRTREVGSAYKFVRWGSVVEEAPESGWLLLTNGGTKKTPLLLQNGRTLVGLRTWASLLGLKLEYHWQDQALFLAGGEVATEITLVNGAAYAPLRDLVTAAGLDLAVDGATKTVTVRKKA